MQIWTRNTQSGKDSGGGREERQWRMRELGGGQICERRSEIWKWNKREWEQRSPWREWFIQKLNTASSSKIRTLARATAQERQPWEFFITKKGNKEAATVAALGDTTANKLAFWRFALRRHAAALLPRRSPLPKSGCLCSRSDHFTVRWGLIGPSTCQADMFLSCVTRGFSLFERGGDFPSLLLWCSLFWGGRGGGIWEK